MENQYKFTERKWAVGINVDCQVEMWQLKAIELWFVDSETTVDLISHSSYFDECFFA